MGKLIMTENEIYNHIRNLDIDENELPAYFTNVIIQKYSKEKQDAMLANVIDLILNVPGGYWQIVENMDYLPEFEHYKWRNTISYEKANVPKTVAKRELTFFQYRKIYK